MTRTRLTAEQHEAETARLLSTAERPSPAQVTIALAHAHAASSIRNSSADRAAERTRETRRFRRRRAAGRKAGPPFELPEGARWAGDDPNPSWSYPHLVRWDWWRYHGGTTVYTGRHHTAMVYCDTEAIADAVIALRHPELAP